MSFANPLQSTDISFLICCTASYMCRVRCLLYSKHEQVLLLSDEVKSEVDNPEKLHLLASLSYHQGLVHQEIVDLPFFQTY